DEVVGVEASPEMRDQAEGATSEDNVRFVQAYAQSTGLAEGGADIVTCSQALHWMEPEPTFSEAARLLRPGGVFAAYDYDWPAVVDPDVDAAFTAYQSRRRAARRARGILRGGDRWHKDGHLQRMRESGCFRVCRHALLPSLPAAATHRPL